MYVFSIRTQVKLYSLIYRVKYDEQKNSEELIRTFFKNKLYVMEKTYKMP